MRQTYKGKRTYKEDSDRDYNPNKPNQFAWLTKISKSEKLPLHRTPRKQLKQTSPRRSYNRVCANTSAGVVFIKKSPVPELVHVIEVAEPSIPVAIVHLETELNQRMLVDGYTPVIDKLCKSIRDLKKHNDHLINLAAISNSDMIGLLFLKQTKSIPPRNGAITKKTYNMTIFFNLKKVQLCKITNTRLHVQQFEAVTNQTLISYTTF
jgi:hypothetical protein